MAEQPFSYLPEPARTLVRRAYRQVPADLRGELQTWLPYALNDAGSARDLLGFITDNYVAAFSQKRMRIAIVGPANTGKSTLYNGFLPEGALLALVTPEPGDTRDAQVSEGRLFTLVDTPPADAKAPERDIALDAARAADFLFTVFDASAGVSAADQRLFDELKALGKPYLVLLNKMDLVAKKDRDRVLDSAAATLGMDRAQIIPISAMTGQNLGRVALAVAQTDPRVLTLIGEALPEYRAKLAWQRTVQAASASAAVALIPLPLADIVPLLGIQTGLVLTIARIYGYEMSLDRAKELIVTFGLGFIARSIWRQLSKFLGVPGWILSAAIAAAATVAMGYIAILWFERGERPSQEAIEKLMRDITVYLRDGLGRLRLKRSDGAGMRKQVVELLEEMPSTLRPQRNAPTMALPQEEDDEDS
jgi:GTP-binding protein Era